MELDYNVSVLKLKEDEQKYENEKSLTDADYKVKELDLNIFRKSRAETKRTLEDAQIRSPRKAILTYVNNEVGAQVSQAVVSLSSPTCPIQDRGGDRRYLWRPDRRR